MVPKKTIKKRVQKSAVKVAKKIVPHDIAILLAGQAGQGVMTIEKILTRTLKREGFFVFATREYMSRVRGGMNSTLIRISSVPVAAPVNRVDLFAPLHPQAFAHYGTRLTPQTHTIGDTKTITACADAVKDDLVCKNTVAVDFRVIANEIGHPIYANTVAAGAILALLDVDIAGAEYVLREIFAHKGQDIVKKNITALQRGYKQGSHATLLNELCFGLERTHANDAQLFLAGHEAVALGALAGGVNFCTSYPMSPSTGVLTYLAQHGKECGVLVEQATDEIGAINMSIGASYAGARTIITTSGGGFALMTEAVSLAAMMETPLTIHLAQRPGPATGQPTRTAQEDLNLALHAGHGEFVRAIYAPGSLAEAFALTQRALDVSDEYQVPTFILTDQYLVDSLAMVSEDDMVFDTYKNHIISTERGYDRYAFTKDGISPRGVPGHGNGLVCADSDEHDESGHITEDLGLRVRMQDKRTKRLSALKKTALMPTWTGKKNAKKLLIVWGSNKAVAQEAWTCAGDKELAIVHFSQVYPLSNRVKTLLDKARKITVMENNMTGQFADLLEKEVDITVNQRINKYNGAPFTVEEVCAHIKTI